MITSALRAGALLLTRSDIAALMAPHDYLDAVDAGFRSCDSDQGTSPIPMHLPGLDGGFHAKGARVSLRGCDYVAVKLNANFPGNSEKYGLPTIQGVVLLCDATHGSLLAIMDSIEITLRRTAAASALAARYLAPRVVDSIAICGCGEQGRAHLDALFPMLAPRCALAWDRDSTKAQAFALAAGKQLGSRVKAVTSIGDATRASQVIVTATTARQPILTTDLVRPGTFIAAVGADNPEKNEIAPALMASATVVVDVLRQAETMGDLHHAIRAGVLSSRDVHAELVEMVVGRKPGRTRDDQVTIFDSTGVAIEDVASAVWIYERALRRSVGLTVSLAGP